MFVHRIIYIIFIKKSKDFLTFFKKVDFTSEKKTLKTNLKRFFVFIVRLWEGLKN